MKTFLLAFLILSSPALLAQEPAPESPGSDSSARSKVLDLAGAFTNDGYRIRDGFWPGEIELKRPKLLEVNLFAGNEYWFCAAAVPPARKIEVTVYDKHGKPVEMETYSDGPSAAAGVEPEVSGQYFVKVELLEGEKSPFCLLYTYK